jgi:hypothetical protein
MSRLSGAFWFVVVIATGMTNFLVKQNVQSLDDKLTQVRKKTVEDQKKIHDLNADWTFLNQPELLADLNNRYIHLAPMSPKQVVTGLDGIPMRPAPPPEDVPPPVAAATPPATQSATPGPNAAAQPATVASAAPTAASAPAQPLSLISTAHAATILAPTPAAPAPAAAPAAAPAIAPAPARPQQPATAAPPATLDGLFAQVAGGR